MLKKRGIAESVFILANKQHNTLVVIAGIVTPTNFSKTIYTKKKGGINNGL
jgi:hypothetical protein